MKQSKKKKEKNREVGSKYVSYDKRNILGLADKWDDFRDEPAERW